MALVGRPATMAVPERVRLPPANGVPAVGRTRTFCQVNCEVWPLVSPLVTVKTSCVGVTEVMLPTTVSDGGPLPVFLIATIGVAAFVSKINPPGAFRIIVFTPISPLAFSV